MSSNDPIAAYVRRAYAVAAMQNHAIIGIPYGVGSLAQALGRWPSAEETKRAETLALQEGYRLTVADELARVLGICLSFDENGRLFRCDDAGREVRAGLLPLGAPGLRWPSGGAR